MKKMERTAGEKTGKDDAIRKDNEGAAEKIDIKTDAVNGGLKKDLPDPLPVKDLKKEKENKNDPPEDHAEEKKQDKKEKNVEKKSGPTDEKGSGLKSAVEGKNSDSLLATDDDGTIVL